MLNPIFAAAPYCRLLGLGKDAAFEEVQDARNYLYELYRWHEPSREAIELAFDRITQVRGRGIGAGAAGHMPGTWTRASS